MLGERVRVIYWNQLMRFYVKIFSYLGLGLRDLDRRLPMRGVAYFRNFQHLKVFDLLAFETKPPPPVGKRVKDRRKKEI